MAGHSREYKLRNKTSPVFDSTRADPPFLQFGKMVFEGFHRDARDAATPRQVSTGYLMGDPGFKVRGR